MLIDKSDLFLKKMLANASKLDDGQRRHFIACLHPATQVVVRKGLALLTLQKMRTT